VAACSVGGNDVGAGARLWSACHCRRGAAGVHGACAAPAEARRSRSSRHGRALRASPATAVCRCGRTSLRLLRSRGHDRRLQRAGIGADRHGDTGHRRRFGGGQDAWHSTASYLVARFTRASLDPDLRWVDVAGLATLAGIGYTVSLLIGELAFGIGSERDEQVKIGVLTGSLLAGLLATAILRARNRTYRRVCAAEERDSDRARQMSTKRRTARTTHQSVTKQSFWWLWSLTTAAAGTNYHCLGRTPGLSAACRLSSAQSGASSSELSRHHLSKNASAAAQASKRRATSSPEHHSQPGSLSDRGLDR
jgi:hypothetical protein